MDEFTAEELIQLEFLRDEEIDELIAANLLNEEERTNTSLRDVLTFKYPEITLNITTGQYYPVFPLTWSIDNHSLPRTVIHYLRSALTDIITQINKVNTLSAWQSRESSGYGIYQREMAVLQLVQETNSHLTSYQESERAKHPPTDISTTTTISSLLPKIEAMDLTNAKAGAAYNILGKTVQEICQMIPPNYRVTHVEKVLRKDLQKCFFQKKNDMILEIDALSDGELKQLVPKELRRDKGRSDHAHWVREVTRPRMTFHGTPRHKVANIVRRGFLKPGSVNPETGQVLGVRCGSTYGRGIYSSPSPAFALSYSDTECKPTPPKELFGLKLFVCAVLMGRTAAMYRDDNWRDQNSPYPGADSHVANGGMEYVVFSPAQILPCYVMHLDWGEDNVRHIVDEDDEGLFGHVAQIRKKQALAARAKKFFPFGFGTATGTRFVVEDVAEVEEDEEEYGEFQEMTVEGFGEGGEGFWKWQERERMEKRDQYYLERTTKE
ncbi:hypothetical protein BDD12DRAFT_868305 [Trichophaea hybrida]|nr:hypothetical protein BDD12DRAFT_868305 [Trichophaea hybrida]